MRVVSYSRSEIGARTQSAHFDVIVASAEGLYRGDSDPMALLGTGLRSFGRKCAFLCESPADIAGRWPNWRTGTGALSVGEPAMKQIAPKGSGVTGGALDPKPFGQATSSGQALESVLLCRSAKLLCLEDRIFDVPGGAEFGRRAADAACRAGRKVALLCHSPRSVFNNRLRIFEELALMIDVLIGEPRAILPLYNFHRIDTLVPRLARDEIGLIMNRSAYLTPTVSASYWRSQY